MDQLGTPTDAPIQVASPLDRCSQREQLEQYLARVQEAKQPARMRLPLSVYNYTQRPQYTDVRDASWNIALPSADLTVEQLEEVIQALHLFMNTLGTVGARGVMARLTPLDNTQGTA